MPILSWIVVGLIAGWLAKILIPGPRGFLATILLGVLGAVVGGWIFQAAGKQTVTGVNARSVLVAFIGAVVVLVIFRLAGF